MITSAPTMTAQAPDGAANPTAPQATGLQKPPAPTPLSAITGATTAPMGVNPSVPPGVQYPVGVSSVPSSVPSGVNPGITPGVEYPVGSAATGAPPASPTATSYAPGVSLTPTNPASDLRSQTITPGPMADRFQIAQSQLKTFNDATEPYYQKALRDATSQAAGAGQLGSGQLRTGLGDLANQRNLQLETQGNDFLNNALSGSIDDAYKNLGIAQQQQGFQSGLQNQSFNQGVAQTSLQDALTNSSASRSLQQLMAGQQGNPADTQLILSQLFGNQASQAGSALSGLIGNTVNRNAQTASTNGLTQLLQSLGLGTGTPSGTATTPPIVPSTGGTATGGLFDPSSWIR